MVKRYCVTFAAPVGSSKTPIAYYLSQKFNLPIFNNDSIRTEVTEDLFTFDQDEYVKRRDQRAKDFISSGNSFILDASIDRGWKELNELLVNNEYDWFIISLDLTKDLLLKLYDAKGYHKSLKRLDELITDHKNFLREYGYEVSVHINDQDFPKRLEIAYAKLAEWIK